MSTEKIKSNVVEAPTMFIGVGGTGCRIVTKVYKYCSVEERENISFVCLDTNVNDLGVIQKNCKDVFCVQTSNTQTVGSYLDNDKDASQNWFPKNAVIYDKTVSEGAGQLRAISRLAFNSTIKTGKIQPLYNAIDALFKKNGQAMKQALRVCVVSTASGGTGSGMILPFCMFLRDYVNNKYPNASVILRTMILLPETLDKVITSNIEKESQRRNAYATIKEINAFMMKGSGFCDIEEDLKRYRDLHVDVTDAGKKGLKTLSVLPCDFCFLLDGQDAEDATSNSFNQYQEQAALALYEQNIGPMQKKAFSVEDNIIKELSNPGNYGRNRFGGIGAGRIIYPYEKVVDYIACDWAKKSIGGRGEASRWLKYDMEVKRKAAEDEKADRPMEECTPKEQAYIEALKQFSEGDSFSKNLMGHYSLNEADTRIRMFLDSLIKAVTAEVDDSAKIKGYKNQLNKLQGEGCYDDPENWSSAASDYQSLSSFYAAVQDITARIAKSTAEGILYNEGKTCQLAEKGDKYLESLIRSPKGYYCHPNAARYMLYSLFMEVDRKVKPAADDVTNDRTAIDNLMADRGDNPYILRSRKDGKEVNSLRELCNIVSSLEKDSRKGKKIGMEAAGSMNDDMRGLFAKIRKLENDMVKSAVYSILRKYLTALNKQYETFFDSFKKKVIDLENRQKDMIDAFRYNKGDSVRNVCVGEKLLEELSRSTFKAMENGMMLDDELNAEIFDKIKANVRFERDVLSNADTVEEDGRVDIFDEVLIGYFRRSIVSNCSKEIDMNVIEAIAKEYKLGEVVKAREDAKEGEPLALKFDRKACEGYIKAVIAEGEKISAPGIQRMVGEEPREVKVCAYNKSLDQMRDYRMDELMDNAEAVDSVSRYELHYFNALYNLTPDKLKKFAAPRKSETGNRPAGLYNSAYTVYTRDIGPDCLKSSKMTTHIDRRWDSIAAMPELDLEYQSYQFLRTHRALIYGLLFDRIQRMKYLDDNSDVKNPAMAYRYRNTHNHIEDMVVSNGTLCDEFYEILDSLYIDRALVEDVYAYEHHETAKDVMSRNEYCETKFYKYLRSFRMPNYKTERSSLFEIPLAYYNSLPSYKHDEAELVSLVEAVIEVFRRQLGKYESEKNARFVLCSELEEQYDLLLRNYDSHKEISKGVKRSENKVLEIISRKVQDIFETSPQPENYDKAIEAMKHRLIGD